MIRYLIRLRVAYNHIYTFRKSLNWTCQSLLELKYSDMKDKVCASVIPKFLVYFIISAVNSQLAIVPCSCFITWMWIIKFVDWKHANMRLQKIVKLRRSSRYFYQVIDKITTPVFQCCISSYVVSKWAFSGDQFFCFSSLSRYEPCPINKRPSAIFFSVGV